MNIMLGAKAVGVVLLAAGIWAIDPLRSAAAEGAVGAAEDVQLRAMADELARSKTLKLNDLDKPYFLMYTGDDGEVVAINASMGGLLSSSQGHSRQSHITVRVGGPDFDNTNSIFSGQPPAIALPLDNNYRVIRDALWIATDGVYKIATEEITRKRTASREMADPDKTPDLDASKPVQMVRPIPTLEIDRKHWEGLVKSLSDRFNGHPDVTVSSVRLRAISSTFRLVNSEGTTVRIPEELTELGVRANALAPDGSRVWDHRFITVLRPSEMPKDDQLARAVETVAEEVQNLKKAPLTEEYTGPVLFEQEAAAEMMAQVLTDALRLERKPLTPPELQNRAPRMIESVWASRLGAKVAPDWLTIVDDPLETKYKNTVLAGQYEVDEEGVPVQRLTLVDKGTLKGFLLTRQPVRTFNASNGHGRLPGRFGVSTPVFGNVFVQAEKAVSEAKLKAQLLELVQTAGLKYGMLIRRLDFPSTAGLEQLQGMVNQMEKSGTTRTLNAPILAYRVYPDGREELVRGVRFKEFSAKDLRDMRAASDHPYVFNYVNTGSSFNYAEAPSSATTSSIICPSLLFDSIDLDKAQGEASKPPAVSPPALAHSK